MNYYRNGPFRPSGTTVTIGVPSLTPMVKNIIIACVVTWFVQLIFFRFWGVDLGEYLGTKPARVVHGWVWQLVTYMFLHSKDEVFHLLFNMLLLWMFGGELEKLWRGIPFLRYYLVCGVGAGIGATLLGLLAGGENQITVGASGAIFGIFVAYGMIFAERRILFMLIFPMKAKTMVLIMCALQLFYLVSASGGNVSYIAHVAGALTGLLYLKRAWRLGEFYRELRWRIRRRKFKMVPPRDPDDRWLN
jgi:membrane associated rhomboid family serine protease